MYAHVCNGASEAKRGCWILRAAVSGDCELSDLGERNRTWVLTEAASTLLRKRLPAIFDN